MKTYFHTADDMGLGKTLTMIALIMTTLAKKDPDDESDDDDDDAKWTRKDEPSCMCVKIIEF